jgi:cell division protein FtsQ
MADDRRITAPLPTVVADLRWADHSGVRILPPDRPNAPPPDPVDDAPVAPSEQPGDVAQGGSDSSAPARTVVIEDKDNWFDDGKGATPSKSGEADGTSIDPRIRDRRRQVKRAKGRRRLRLLIALVVVAALLAGATAVLRSSLFAVRSVSVTGAVTSDPAAIADILDTVRGRPMVSVDLDAIRGQLEALPWIKRATVTRRWPRSVAVDIRERRPVAYYPADDGQWRVLDSEGRVLAAIAGQPADLVQIVGEQTAVAPGQFPPELIMQGAWIVNELPTEITGILKQINVDPAYGYRFELIPSGEVLIGGGDDLRAKLLRVLAVLTSCPAGSFTLLDVRLERPVKTPEGACTGTDAALTGGKK